MNSEKGWKTRAIDHPLYRSWKRMCQRCRTRNGKNYRNYGARGIFVCDRWERNFWAFASDMSPKPPGFSLDRINNNGPYAPWNCRWASAKQQVLNSRRSKASSINGKLYSRRDMAKILGVPQATMCVMIKKYGLASIVGKVTLALSEKSP